jgi:SPP1 gp7 family putative phage head morphogenesis protein
MQEAIAELALLFEPIYTDHIREAGQHAMLLVSATGFDYEDPAILSFLQRRPQKISKFVNRETDKQLRAELAEGIAAGESIEELGARIEKVYAAAAGYRSERIARTETIRANNFASIEAWKQSGVVEAKEWFTAKDDRLCQYCRPMDGKTVSLKGTYFKLGEEFEGDEGDTLKFDFESIQGPPLHPNCRCTLLPVLKDIDEI